jgi:hypothetical protein
MMRNKQFMVALVATAACALAIGARAQVLVNDTWRDGTRTDPGSITYAENNGVTAVDADVDGDFESTWFKGGSGTLAVVTNYPPITGPNILEGTMIGSSAHWYTYFTQPGTPVTLSAPGQEMKLTWVFTPNGVGAQNNSSAFTVALALAPTRFAGAGDGTAPQANYTGAFAAFMNMGTTFGTTPISLRKWNISASSSLLGAAGNYSSSLATAGAALTTGYANGVQYTYVMDMNMTASGLQVTETMSGGSLGGSGTLSATYLDTSYAGGSVSYDTFMIRPANNTSTANTFDTSLFKVEIIPEPSTVALILMGLGLTAGLIRRRRS